MTECAIIMIFICFTQRDTHRQRASYTKQHVNATQFIITPEYHRLALLSLPPLHLN